jgi:hypothetical protein
MSSSPSSTAILQAPSISPNDARRRAAPPPDFSPPRACPRRAALLPTSRDTTRGDAWSQRKAGRTRYGRVAPEPAPQLPGRLSSRSPGRLSFPNRPGSPGRPSSAASALAPPAASAPQQPPQLRSRRLSSPDRPSQRLSSPQPAPSRWMR